MATSDSSPTLKQLMSLHVSPGRNIIQSICTKYDSLVIFLLEDENATLVEQLQMMHKHDPEAITKAIFKTWLGGTGRSPITWRTLIDVLKEIQLVRVAEVIEANISKGINTQTSGFTDGSSAMDGSSAIVGTGYVNKLMERFQGNSTSTKLNVSVPKHHPTVNSRTPKVEEKEKETIVPGLVKPNIDSVQDQKAATQSFTKKEGMIDAAKLHDSAGSQGSDIKSLKHMEFGGENSVTPLSISMLPKIVDESLIPVAPIPEVVGCSDRYMCKDVGMKEYSKPTIPPKPSTLSGKSDSCPSKMAKGRLQPSNSSIVHHHPTSHNVITTKEHKQVDLANMPKSYQVGNVGKQAVANAAQISGKNALVLKQAHSFDRDIPKNIKTHDYYTIALFGKSGQGKSTTGNKLLAINDDKFISHYQIKEWRCCDNSLLKICSEGELKAFKPGAGAESVTKQCQMLSNEQTRIRVLDIPGFADSQSNSKTTVQRNAGLIDSVSQIQCELNIRFHCILYFLPNRGVLERSDAYCQDELKTLYHYFGDSIFRCMVIVVTKHKRDKSVFVPEDYDDMEKTLQYTMKEVTKPEKPICPPVVHIPFDGTPEEVLTLVQTALKNDNNSLDPNQMFQAYTGDEKWEEWIKHFESAAAKRSLNSRAKLQMMKNILTGPTKVAFEKISEPDEVTYEFARYELQKHIYCERYIARKKKSNEQWKDFAVALWELASNAFPDMQRDKLQEKVINSVRLQAIEHVRNLALPDHLSLDSIVTIVTATEAIPIAYTADVEKGWKPWIMNFDRITTQRSLDESTKVQWLKARLAGKALDILNGLSKKQCVSYNLTKESFCKELYIYFFKSREKHQAERWDSYADEINILAVYGYPSLTIAEQETIVLEHILSQIKNPPLKSRHWKTLNEAVIFLTAIDEIPDAYQDETGKSWEMWLTNFETKCGIKNTQKLQWLKVRISNNLLPLFEIVCQKMKDDYNKVVIEFKELLECRECFKSREKLTTEDWKELCEDLCFLATKFVPEKQQNDVVLNQLLSIIEKNGFNLPNRPQTLEEALVLVNVTNDLKTKTIRKFSGEGNWETWLTKFESALHLESESLTEDAKVKFLRGHLDSNALALFETLPCDAMTNYATAKRDFAIQFYVQRFQVRKKSNESWKQYADDLNTIAQKAFPNMQETEQKMKVLKQFIADPKMKDDVKKQNPEDITAAVDIATAMEAIPVKYSEQTAEGWEQWIEYFESQASLHNVNKTAKVLCVCLAGKPRKIFEEKVNTTALRYELAKNVLQKELYKDLFNSRVRLDDEFIDDFAEDIKLLAEKAYPKPEADKMVVMKLKELIKKPQDGVYIPHIWLDTLDGAILTFKVLEAMNYKQFGDGDDWSEWISHFENTVAESTKESNDYAKLQCFESCISGDAKTYYKDSKYYRKKFENAKNDVTRAIYIKVFQSRIKQESESWRQLAIDLQHISEKAYLDCSDLERDEQVLSRFLNIANNKSLTETCPKDTEWAVTLLEYWEMPPDGVQLTIRACTKCCLKSVKGKPVVEDQDGNCFSYAESKCHGKMIDKYTTFEKAVGGTVHFLTLGLVRLAEAITDSNILPGYTNSEKICINCRESFGTDGCLQVGLQYRITEESGHDCNFAVDHTFGN